MNRLIKNWAKDCNCYLTRENRQMTIEHMKRCSTSNIIRELQIKNY